MEAFWTLDKVLSTPLDISIRVKVGGVDPGYAEKALD